MDVTDATFATDVVERSRTVPVVLDLWATWCGPCQVLSPILEKVIGETNGAVELAKVDVDRNAQIAQAFRVQSIPAVFALRDGQVVDGFTGAVPEAQVRAFVEQLAPGASQVDRLVAEGGEPALREALALDPTNVDAAVALASFLYDADRLGEAREVLAPFEGQSAIRTVAARISLAEKGVALSGDLDGLLAHLVDQAAANDEARRGLLEILDALGPEDPRAATYRRRLAARLH